MRELDTLSERLTGMLGEEMDAACPDLKKLRELSSLVREVNALRRELRGEQPQTVVVRFDADAEACSV